MEYIISINKVKVRTPNRISIDGYILWAGRTDIKCKFDYIGTDIENWDSEISLSDEQKNKLKDSLKAKFGFSNFDIKNVKDEITKDIQVRFECD